MIVLTIQIILFTGHDNDKTIDNRFRLLANCNHFSALLIKITILEVLFFGVDLYCLLILLNGLEI